MTDDGRRRRRRWRRRTTATTNDGDDGRRWKNLVHSFCQKSWILEKLRVFEKQRKFDFFQRSVPLTKEWNDGWRRRRTMATTNDGDDERRRRRTTVKKSRALILPKILNFRKIARFWKTAKIWFFSKVRPFDERVKWRTTTGRRRRRTTATTNDGDDERRRRRTTAKKSHALILPKILNFRKIASFWKTAKIWFFSKVRPFDERVKWRMTDDGDDGRWRRRTTANDERLRRRTMVKKSHALILPKILNFRKIASFWKTAKIWFFSKVRPFDERVKWRMTDDGDDGRWRRRTTATTNDGDDGRRWKNLVHSFCQKSWILEKLRDFEKQRKFDFFQRSVPLTKEWNDGWRTTATTDDGDDERRRRRTTAKKSRALILPKILNFRKIASFWKTAKIWFFSKVRPFDERVKWRTTATTDDGDDGRQRRLTMATTNDGDDGRRRKNLMHSFCQKSWILGKLPVFEKQQKFDLFSKVRPFDERVKWRMTDDGDDGRWRRRTTATTNDGDDGRRWKNLVHSFCQKSWILEKLRDFEKQRKFDFFQRSVPLTKEWNDGWRTTRRRRRDDERRDDGRRRKNLVHSFCQKSWILEKLRVFEKQRKFDFFQRSVPLTKEWNDGRWRTTATTRRLTMATTNDGDDGRRRKNLMHSFCQKSWILGKLPVFEKQQKFDFFQRSVPLTKEWNDGWRTTATMDDGDDERRRRRTTATTDDGEKISTHFAKNLEF